MREMGRKPLVDREVALDRIMRRFWAHGYEATSIDDLLEASGMHRGSFYRAFGDKHSAFVAALARYGTVVGNDHVLPALAGRGSSCPRLLRLLYARLDAALGLPTGPRDAAPAGDGPRPGCLVVKTAVEVAPHDDEARATVASWLDAMRAAIGCLVHEAIAVGEVGPDVDGELAADQIFTLLQGVNVLSCAGGDRRQLRRLLRSTVQGTLRPTVPLP
jgi:TetR/AcrR family transcriptional regulator, transcriptional repressor for nem operon